MQMLTSKANTSPFLCFPHDSYSITLTINCLLSLPPHLLDYSHTSHPLTLNTKNSTAASIRLTVGISILSVKLPKEHLMFPLTLLLKFKRRAKFSEKYFIINFLISLSGCPCKLVWDHCSPAYQYCCNPLYSSAVLCFASGLTTFWEPKAIFFLA